MRLQPSAFCEQVEKLKLGQWNSEKDLRYATQKREGHTE